MDEETKKKLKDLEDRVKQLETRRLHQSDFLPQIIKFRHLDWVEISSQGPILVDTVTGWSYRLKVTSGVLGIVAV